MIGRTASWSAFVLLVACGASAPAAPPAPSAAAPPAPPVANDAPPPDRRADCKLVADELEIGPEKTAGYTAAATTPESPLDRDMQLRAIDRYLEKWDGLARRIRSTDVRSAGEAYVAALRKHRAALAALSWWKPEPEPPAPRPPPSKTPMTDAELARKVARDQAAEWARSHMAPTTNEPLLREADRRALQESRDRYVDAWSPLMGMCDDEARRR